MSGAVGDERSFLDSPPPPWPQWLEDARIDDAIVDMAYEVTPPQWRAAVKTGLALAFSHFGRREEQLDSVTRKPHAGFWMAHKSRPVPWCLLVIDASYAAAARVTAACVLPRLCDVPEVFAVIVGEDDGNVQPADSTLTALTLSGVDDVFCLSAERAQCLLQELATGAANAAQGRLLLLHGGRLASLAAEAKNLHVPCYEESEPPVLALLPDCPCSPDLLAFVHGDVAPAPALGPETQAVLAPAGGELGVDLGCDAVREALERGLLVLAPGCEGFWLHPGLYPEFFTLRGLAAGML